MKKSILLSIMMAFLCSLSMFSEQWRLHPTYSEYLNRIIDTPRYTYILSRNQPFWTHIPDNAHATNSLFRYDKEDKETIWLNVQNKLSGTIIVAAEYDFENHYLMVCYDDGNIDLVYDNGDVVNVPGLKVADAYEKNLYSITFIPGNPEVYLATDFGYITVNDNKEEIGTSRILDKSFRAAAGFDGKVFLGASDGLYHTAPRGSSVLTKIGDVTGVNRMVICGNRLYVYGGEKTKGYVGYIDAGEENPTLNILVSGLIMAFEPVTDGVLISGPSDIWHYATDGTMTHSAKDTQFRDNITVKDTRNRYWVDLGLHGVANMEAPAGSPSWSGSGEIILPNAANGFKATAMTYNNRYGMLVQNHGIDYNFTSIEPATPDYISGLRNMEWTSYSPSALAPDNPALKLGNPNGLVTDPDNDDVVYCASVLDGILALNLADISKSIRIGRINDAAAGQPGYIAAFKSGEVLPQYFPLTAPAFDNDGTMWTIGFDIDYNFPELLYWTAADRRATTSQSDYKPFRKWQFTKNLGSVVGVVVPLRVSANKNIIVVAIRENNVMKVINHNGTLDNRNDDTEYTFTTNIYDQDNNLFDSGYYSAFYEDPSTGYLWVGATRGVFYINPRELTSGGDTRVNRIKVARNDGTSLADYLLDGVDVNVITADGSGRKWFATNGAGLVCTSASGTEVIRTYTEENSLLPSNTVYGICYNPENNSMMVSTNAGLAELFLSGTSVEAGDDSAVVAYPNPVRPDYFGYVNIEGLQEGALVKIADNAGNMIKELGLSADGTARWDVTNYNNKRVRSGVYYVLTSSGPDNSGFAAATKILVVN